MPSGSTAMKLAGPVVLSSASCCNCTPWAFSWRCSSRTSVNEASFWALLVPAGVEGEDVLLEHPLKQADHVIAVLQDQPVLRGIPGEDLEAELLVERSSKPRGP